MIGIMKINELKSFASQAINEVNLLAQNIENGRYDGRLRDKIIQQNAFKALENAVYSYVQAACEGGEEPDENMTVLMQNAENQLMSAFLRKITTLQTPENLAVAEELIATQSDCEGVAARMNELKNAILAIKQKNAPQKPPLYAFPSRAEILERANRPVRAFTDADEELILELMFENAYHEMIPNLYLGGAYEPQKFVGYNGRVKEAPQFDLVVHVSAFGLEDLKLQAAPGKKDFHFDKIGGYNDVSLASLKANDQAQLRDCILQIDQALREGKKVAVQCQQGKDRSSTIIMAYMMSKYGLTVEQALNFNRNQRRIVEDKPDYMDFLRHEFKRVPLNAH
jgi:hypothetical protein